MRPFKSFLIATVALMAPLNLALLATPSWAQDATVAKTYGTWGFDPKDMDPSVKPGDDFFFFANGSAYKSIVIPDDRTSYGSFVALRELSQNRLKVILDRLSTAQNLKGEDLKVAMLYKSMIDQDHKNALGLKPIAKTLAAIKAVKSKTAFASLLGGSVRHMGSSLLSINVSDDAKKAGFNALYLGQVRLSLPDRDYYLDAKFADKKAKFKTYISALLTQAGYDKADEKAEAIIAFETKLAEANWTRIESRDRTKTYTPMALSELKTYAPGLNWDVFFKAAGVEKASKVVLTQNTAIPKIAKIYADTPLETLKIWETFKTINEAAPYLSSDYSDLSWGFWERDLTGAKVQAEPWKRAQDVVERNMGEALGKAYVADYFPADSKTKMIELVGNLRAALKARIQKLSWMSDETKAKALEKLSKFTVKIAYPDKWRDYSKLEIKSGDLIGNLERSSAFEWQRDLDRLEKPIDRSEWGMTPQTVNAYYSSTRNEIVFPAAILQPPFFDPKADMAVNYGGIGAVIGHEMSHGFDDQGRRSDGDGNLTDWWTPEDSKKFEVQTARLGAQYDAFEPLPGIHVKGGLTMGENIGDLGGLLTSIDAYHMSLKGQPAPVIDGFSGDQRLFFGFAQIWRSKYRDDAIKQQVVSDPHSPAQFRAIGTTRNIDLWYDTFGVKEGDKYYVKPEDRVRIW